MITSTEHGRICDFCRWNTAMMVQGSFPLTKKRDKAPWWAYVALVACILAGALTIVVGITLLGSHYFDLEFLTAASLTVVLLVVTIIGFSNNRREYRDGTMMFCPHCGAFYALTLPPGDRHWDMPETARMLGIAPPVSRP